MVILLVDDDQFLRLGIKAILRKEGFQIIEADDGIDACEIIKEIGSTINLLLTDINMPRMDGLSLAESAKEWHPKMPVLLMTGQTSSAQKATSSYVVLHKPFLRQPLLEAVWKVITAAALEDNAPGSCRSKLALQQHLQAEVQKAKDRYDEASHRLRKMLEEQNQELLPSPDGAFGVRQALRQESRARQEHMRRLRILTDIMTSDGGLENS